MTKKYMKGDYTNCRCNICEIVDEYDEIVCNVATEDFEKVIRVFEENEQLKQSHKELGIAYDNLVKLGNDLEKENEELKKAFNDFIEYDDEDFKETKHINSIYKEEGFNGVIDYAKDKLQHYGVVREVEEGLWVMITGGWSDNEFFIHCLNNILSNFGRKHYRAYEKGGAFYYTEEPRADVEITLKKELKE